MDSARQPAAMALLINNDVAARALTMRAPVEAMESVLGPYAQGLATFPPRMVIRASTAVGGDFG